MSSNLFQEIYQITMTHLSQKKCILPDESGEALEGNDITHYMAQLDNSWRVLGDKYLSRVFNFPEHEKAVSFVQKVSESAIDEGHVPDTFLSYGEVKIVLQTPEVYGLHENDFIVAAKIDKTYRESFKGK